MITKLLPADSNAPAYLTIEHTNEEAYCAAPGWRLLGTCVERYIIRGRTERTTIISEVYEGPRQ